MEKEQRRDRGKEKERSMQYLLLNDVVGDGSTTVVGWLGPPQGHRLLVEVTDPGVQVNLQGEKEDFWIR